MRVLSAGLRMKPPTPRSRPPEPFSDEDAAQSLVEAGLAESYDEARADIEEARSDVREQASRWVG